MVLLVPDLQKPHPVSSQVSQKQIPGFSDPVGVAGRPTEEPVKHTATTSVRGEDARCEAPSTSGAPHPNSEANKRVLEGLVFGFAPTFEACMVKVLTYCALYSFLHSSQESFIQWQFSNFTAFSWQFDKSQF